MKIGIFTFHWATNHGAILQAFALQNFLQTKNPQNEVWIIDYYPRKYDKNFKWLFKSLNPVAIKKKSKEYYKEKKLGPFRNLLNRTERYYSTEDLQKQLDGFDVLITGSDQVWNEAFTLRGEGKITQAYYLPFENVGIRFSYAASFGYTVMNEEIKEIITPWLKSLTAISVREKSGQDMLSDLGIQSSLVCDPTLLLKVDEYKKLIEPEEGKKYIAKYILRRQGKEANSIIDAIMQSTKEKYKVKNIELLSINEWLRNIHDAALLVTNSFHGVVFALLFHTPFWVILENESNRGMNDRLETLLSSVNLQNRIVRGNVLLPEANGEIDWADVDHRIEKLSADSKLFLSTCMRE